MSFALGVSLHEINEWEESDLWYYSDFVRQHGFPQDRIEHLLAQIPLIYRLSKGDKKVTIDTFSLKTDTAFRQPENTPKRRKPFGGFTGAVPRKKRKF